MPSFAYQSVTRSGEAATGTIEAADRAEVVRLLRDRGEVAVAVDVARGGSGGGGGRGLRSRRNGAAGPGAASAGTSAVGGGMFGMGGGAATATGAPAKSKARPLAPRRTTGRGAATEPAAGAGGSFMSRMSGTSLALGRRSMSRSELTSFIREIATALEAGLPLMNALRAVARQATSPRQAEVLAHLMDRIESGRSFAQAASEWGAPFNDMIIGMIRSGEASGRLDAVLLDLAELLERDSEIRRAMAGALVYPAILVVLLSVGIVIITTVTIPKVLSAVGDDIVMPLPTIVVLGFAQFMAQWWWALVLGIVLFYVGFRAAYAQPDFRYRFDQVLLHIPVLGSMLRNVAVGRFTRTLGTLMGAGLPIIDALLVTRDTLGNRAMEAVIDEVAEKIRAGKSIAEPMEKSGYFPPVLIQIISLGERSGRLDQMLLHAAGAFERRTQSAIKMFMNVLPPIILVVMAVVVGFVLAGALLPLLEMQSAIG